MKRWVVVGIVVVGALSVWFLNRQREKAITERLVQQCEQDGPSEEQFEIKLPSGQSFRVAEHDRLVQKYASIKQGNSRSDVRGLLGSPSYVRPNVDRDGIEYYGCYWGYVLRRSIEGEREVDDVIQVFFDPSGHVRSNFRRDETWTTIHPEDMRKLRKKAIEQ